MIKWAQLPVEMQVEEVRYYYDILQKHKLSLVIKRSFDIFAAAIMLIILLPLFIIIAITIKIDSSGAVFYRQERITQYGRRFKIHKFRTMQQGADKLGSLITINNDKRITHIGGFLRKYRLDEFPQLIDVLRGNMTFVGCRPEVSRYVQHYTPKMLATLLLPAGITSEACIHYKNEAILLSNADDVDKVYIEKILPEKMSFCLKTMENYSLYEDISIMFRTVFVLMETSKRPMKNKYTMLPDNESKL